MPDYNVGDERKLLSRREREVTVFSPWLTTSEACIYLRCKMAHLYRHMDKLTVRKFGGKTLISLKSVEAYLEAHPIEICTRGGKIKKRAA